MYRANLNQVYRDDGGGSPLYCWVILLTHGAGTVKEDILRDKHRDIESLLLEQSVGFVEITTRVGKDKVYEKFGFREGRHPLFFVFSKHPLDYEKGDPLLVVEWCKWPTTDEFRDDLMAFVNSFSHADFRQAIASAQDASVWQRVGKFLNKYGLTILKVGATVAAALA